MLCFLWACANEDTGKEAEETVGVDSAETGETGETGETDGLTETDTDPVDSDSGDPVETGETATTVEDCPVPSDSFTWVAAEITVADDSTGHDFDGDGEVDNALAPFATLLDPELAAFTAAYSNVLILQVWELEDLCNDEVSAGILNGLDLDGNPGDNHSGSEAFDASADLDAYGHARAEGPGSIVGSQFDAAIDDAVIDLGFISLPAATTAYVSGEIGVEFEGWLATVVSYDDLAEAATQMGLDADFLSYVLDLDLDGDGEMDALSATFEAHAVPCLLNE